MKLDIFTFWNRCTIINIKKSKDKLHTKYKLPHKQADKLQITHTKRTVFSPQKQTAVTKFWISWQMLKKTFRRIWTFALQLFELLNSNFNFFKHHKVKQKRDFLLLEKFFLSDVFAFCSLNWTLFDMLLYIIKLFSLLFLSFFTVWAQCFMSLWILRFSPQKTRVTLKKKMLKTKLLKGKREKH